MTTYHLFSKMSFLYKRRLTNCQSSFKAEIVRCCCIFYEAKLQNTTSKITQPKLTSMSNCLSRVWRCPNWSLLYLRSSSSIAATCSLFFLASSALWCWAYCSLSWDGVTEFLLLTSSCWKKIIQNSVWFGQNLFVFLCIIVWHWKTKWRLLLKYDNYLF